MKVSEVKYDIVINDIKYYELATKHRHLFPPKHNGINHIEDFHYYSYKNEKYEIVLHVIYDLDEYNKEISRLNEAVVKYYGSVLELDGITRYVLKNNGELELYEYAIADSTSRCIYYVYSYGIKYEYSAINKNYRI